MTTNDPGRQVHYEVNVCGGTFESVRGRFPAWQREPLLHSPQRTMFEDKAGVRRLDDTVFDSAEAAQRALRRACAPGDREALAAPIVDGERSLWLVMAAFVA
ncbi:hypothetical protein [Burkholderia plantarii]|uniref:Uncharacterized protein n=1 Tax=Burkholderia plantarii TaxID=41899 RepID=A0A0B6S157_BURPL|nr:hypothetical protein [Burkholderia plantarii]AJK48149.1 hypothetical protein BGL_2c00510 [Burkholderia plantarii]ALK32340.1 hypothetical protein bpln_2g00540 [Burkholderia plantarii]WLE61463.1 hypothetical protein GIY62_28790 [Burkholderia plantarii]GLZ18879.1 hypothetical protein Bpla01_24090 [Burkholderia plantarii]